MVALFFYRQQRVGKHGTLFNIYKFRSMVIDADKTGAKVTASHDPRITRIGSLLRKTKIDELPQLFNVLTGDMILVGPRPEVPYYVSKWPDACNGKQRGQVFILHKGMITQKDASRPS